MHCSNITKIYLKFLAVGVCFFGFFGSSNYCTDNVQATSVTQEVQIDKVQRYRDFLEQYFEHKNGRKINFAEYREEAEKLYNGIKAFLEEAKDVAPEHFDEAVKNYIEMRRAVQNLEVSVLDRENFDKTVSDSNLLKLYLGEWRYKRDEVNKFNSGNEVFNVQGFKKGEFKNKGGEILKATNCEGVVNYYQYSSGPWLLFAKSEYAVDLSELNKVDSKHLEELVEIIKYDHPEEFGFVDEIEKYVDFDCLKNHYLEVFKNKDAEFKAAEWGSESNLEKDANDTAIATYVTAPNTIFSSYCKNRDDLYREKVKYSFFDLCFYKARTDEEKKAADDAANEMSKYEKEMADKNKVVGVGAINSENDEDYDAESKIYYINKNMAALQNLKLLAAILDYDVLFYAYDMSGELGVDKYDPKIIPDEKNGDYVILRCKNLNICNEFKVAEREKVIDKSTGEKNYELKFEGMKKLN